MLPPDSTPKSRNTLYLAGKACEKEYEQNARTPFVFRQVKPAYLGSSFQLIQKEAWFPASKYPLHRE